MTLAGCVVNVSNLDPYEILPLKSACISLTVVTAPAILILPSVVACCLFVRVVSYAFLQWHCIAYGCPVSRMCLIMNVKFDVERLRMIFYGLMQAPLCMCSVVS
jgi:hypothetical protein